MKLTRSSRLVAAFIALISLLFMQLAVAAYACPELRTGKIGHDMASTVSMSDASVVPCHDMDREQPNLCHAHVHDQAGKQSLDKPLNPPVQPFLLVGLALPLVPVEPANRPITTPWTFALPAHASAPPLAIRHCCFRL